MGERLDTARQVWHGLQEDFRDTRQHKGLVVALGSGAIAATAVAYQLGGLELTLTTVGPEAYEATNNFLVGAAAVGGSSALIEAGLTLGVTAFLRRSPKMTQAFVVAKYHGEEPPVSEHEGRMAKIRNGLDKAVFWATLGSPGAVGYSYVHAPEASTSVHRKSGMQAAGALGAINTGLGLLAFGGASVVGKGVEKLFGVNGADEWVTERVQDPKTWWTLIGGYLLARVGSKGIKRLAAVLKHPAKTDVPSTTAPEAPSNES